MPRRAGINSDGTRPFLKDTSCKVTLYPNDPDAYGGAGRNISNFVTEIKIEEGINQSSLLTTLTIRDGVNMIDDMRISGNERIDLQIHYPGIDVATDGRVRNFYISDVINFSRHLQVQTYQFVCISELAYLSSLKILRRSFESGIGDEIQNILENDLHPSDGQAKNYFIKKSGGMVKGIYPNKNPIEAINWLIRNANTAGSPYYFFESLSWEQQDKRGKGGFVFGSFNDFLEEARCFKPLSYNYTPYNQGDREVDQYEDLFNRSLLKVSTDLGMSKFNQIPEGAYGSSFLGVDLAKKKIYINDYKYEHDEMKSLNKYQSFATTKASKFGDKFLNEYKGRRFYTSFNSLAYEGDIGNYNSVILNDPDALQKSIAKDANLNYLTHTITAEGNFELYPGQVIEIKLPKATAPEFMADSVMHDEILSGNFMITRLTHTFKEGEYMIKAECQSDSSMTDLNKPIPPTKV